MKSDRDLISMYSCVGMMWEYGNVMNLPGALSSNVVRSLDYGLEMKCPKAFTGKTEPLEL